MSFIRHESVEDRELKDGVCDYCGGSGEIPSDDVKGEMVTCAVCGGSGKK